MKPLLLILTMAAFAAPAKASDTPIWKTMDDGELQEFAKIIVQSTHIAPEVAFGKTADPGQSRLRVRTYPRGEHELLLVESSLAKGLDKEVIRRVQLKRVRDDGSVELRWELLPGKPAPAQIRVKDLNWIIERKAPRNGPTDFPESEYSRPAS